MGARNIDEGRKASSDINSSLPSSTCTPVQLDVTSKQDIHRVIREQIEPALKRMKEEGGGKGVNTLLIVNNAGVYEDGWDEQRLERTLQTNVMGPIHMIEAVLESDSAKQVETLHFISLSSGYGSASCQPDSVMKSIMQISSIPQLKEAVSDTSKWSALYSSSQKQEYVAMYKLSKALLNRGMELFASEITAVDGGDGKGKERRGEQKGRSEDERKGEKEKEHMHRTVLFNNVDPGWVRTRMGGQGAPLSPAEGADTVVWLGLKSLSQVGVDGVQNGVVYKKRRVVDWKRE